MAGQQRGEARRDSLEAIPRGVLLPRMASDLEVGGSVFAPRRPSNVRTAFEYDARSGMYLLRTYLGEHPLGTPIAYTPREYLAYMARRQEGLYFDQLNREALRPKTRSKAFDPLNMTFGLGVAERIFGPGGIKLRLAGSVDLSAGVRSTRTDNPALSERARRSTYLDFDEKIQAGVQASVGTKLNFSLNYNTESTFDFDARKLKLAFEGEDDDIIKLIEAGNVSMQPRNSLISGGGALFGLHTKMQLGRLTLDMIASQQRTQRRRVATGGGAQTTSYEISASSYDEHRHFFLAEYFRSQYDQALETLPYVRSAVKIGKVEVWVTNRRGNYSDARDVVAFADLGEARRVHSPNISLSNAGAFHPRNAANSLYATLLADPNLRHSDQVARLLSGLLRAGQDYEKVESARKLDESEYVVHETLGFITLNTRLQPDEVLAVAFEYTHMGQVYRVGEFASDRPEGTTDNIYVKLLKGTDMSPSAPYWAYMMRNAYSLGSGVSNVQGQDFELEVYYRSDRTGTDVPYLPSGALQGRRFMDLLGLDRMNQRQQPQSDGRFDYLEGVTVNASRGIIYLPSVEPFGATLSGQGVEEALVYSELYDRPLVRARQVAEKNKYSLRGRYRATTSGEISLGAVNITPGSVRVVAAGATLVENVDYTVDYLSGMVRIINEQIASSRTPIEVSLEDGGALSAQRKTLLGVDLGYQLGRNLHLGATAMYLSEMPLTTKTALGEESMRNFIWGANLSWRHESQWLTNLLDKIPLLEVSKPSHISLDAEFAHLIPGHYESHYSQGYSYLDDFETSRGEIDLMSAYAWSLSSVPTDRVATSTTGLETGYGRAHLSWFSIDPLFTREHSSRTPAYIRNNPDLVSNHYVREVELRELYPYRDLHANQVAYMQTFSLRYYPAERGPYNLNTSRLGSDGRFVDPTSSWGGIMRRIDQTDFETANIEYLEFWLMDPFAYDPTATGGDLYFNIGDISEDILRDEKKFFENGLPIVDNDAAVAETPWGRVPTQQSIGYSFDNTPGARARQDVGLNGLSSAEELVHASYTDYLTRLRARVSPSVLGQWADDAYSPMRDPGGDDFHHYRGDDYDALRLPILERYKYYNGTEGNSAETTASDLYSVASRVVPDVEDLNQDNSLNELDRYYEYRISLRPADMRVGTNYIVASREAEVMLRNGQQSRVRWYQFKVPLSQPTGAVGGIGDRRSMRFMRMYLTEFDREVDVRFGSLRLVRGDWRTYTQSLAGATTPTTEAKLSVGAVNIEEHGDRRPINYVLPPNVPRSLDAQAGQGTQLNEQALSLKIQGLAPGDARAIYRNTSHDLRRYRRLQLYTHAEQLIEDDTQTASGELSVFIRLGSDYQSNYYEYSVPLTLTPEGLYNGNLDADQRRVWPDANMINIDLDHLTALKKARNASMASSSGASLYQLFTAPAPDAASHTIGILGNPSLSNVRTIMIGVRNRSGQVRSIEVWVNELRVGDYRENEGWAANANLGLQLSDLGALHLRGQVSTAGFGGIDQSLGERQVDDRRGLHLSSSLQLGKFFPDKAKVNIPLYLTYSEEQIKPKYNPRDEDILLSEALATAPTESDKQAITDYALTRRTNRSITLANASVGIKSREPMPYDPANLSLSFSHSTAHEQSPALEYQHQLHWQAGLSYDYTPAFRPLRPFKGLKGQGTLARYLKQYGLNLWPSRLQLQTTMMRSYEEEQIRNHIDDLSGVKLPATFAQQFVWYRKLSLAWTLTPNLTFALTAGTDARIEEPHVQVNRALNPDDYARWREAVDKSIAELGTPQRYAQTASASYTLPTQALKALSWINSSVSYSSAYTWDLGADLPTQGLRLANTIANQMSIESSTQLRLRSLYAQWGYLSRLEQRFGGNASTAPTTRPQRYVRSVTLVPDSVVRIEHRLGSRRVAVVARDSVGRARPIATRILDANTIELRATDSLRVEVVVSPRSVRGVGRVLREVLDRGAYTLMMIKDISLSYRRQSSTHLPGYLPGVGAALGQSSRSGHLAPGLGFALGLTGNAFIEEATRRGWLSSDTEQVQPGVYAEAQTIDLKATLQPIRDLTITLVASHSHTARTEHQFMYASYPRLRGGDLTMTTIGLRGVFDMGDANSSYASAPFERFLASRAVVADRLGALIASESYPTEGFLVDEGLSGMALAGHVQTDPNSSATLIPAFRSAYTHASRADRIDLDPTPSWTSMLPNWSLSYSGLSRLKGLKDLFRSVVLRHTYRGVYRIDTYSSYPRWVGIGDGSIGVVPDAAGGAPRLSLSTDIATISLQENFFPLIGLDVALHNGLTLTAQWRRSKAVTLGLSAYRLVETMSNELNIGASYKIADLQSLLSPSKARRNSQRRNKQHAAPAPKGLSLKADYSYRYSLSLIRQIQTGYTQATAGHVDSRLSLSAEYDLSRMLTLRAYYELTRNRPLVSTTSFPVLHSTYGLSLRFNLMQ